MGDREMVMGRFLKSRTGAFLKLVRFENLLMIALTQLLIRSFVLQKVLNSHSIPLELSDGIFMLMVLSTMLIAAAGYIINDYFDVKTDTINHPDTVVVDRVISRRTAIILHSVFTLAGVLMGMYAAISTGYLRLASFHVGAAVLLWFYSTDLKKKAVIGNVAVALLTAAVTIMPFMYEIGVMQKADPGFLSSHRYALLSAFKYAWIYSLFAFITTFAREIIKDMEDYEGDAATGARTLPIVWGTNASRMCAFFLLLITAILLMFVLYNTVRIERVIVSISNLYIIFVLILPLLLLAGYLLSHGTTRQFHRASAALKLIMLAGLLYAVIFYYT
jgi:4-hydroxybenzoate polyprenyltransferase